MSGHEPYVVLLARERGVELGTDTPGEIIDYLAEHFYSPPDATGATCVRRLRVHFDALAAERDALQRRLAAAEAGIAAEIERANVGYELEWPADLAGRGRFRGRIEGLEIARRIVGGA